MASFDFQPFLSGAKKATGKESVSETYGRKNNHKNIIDHIDHLTIKRIMIFWPVLSDEQMSNGHPFSPFK